MKKICPNCGIEYDGFPSRDVFCSKKCYLQSRRTNKYIELDNYFILRLFSKHGETDFIIDKEDYKKISKHTWSLTHSGNKNFYAFARINKQNVKLHRFIMNPPEDKVIDHIDRNPRNNRKLNLRICTALENGRNQGMKKSNKSGYKNISYCVKRNTYVFQIQRCSLYINKHFKTLEDALKARELFFKNNPQYTLIE